MDVKANFHIRILNGAEASEARKRMKISHIALYTKDIEKIREFYKKYFNAIENEKYHNVKTGLETYFLSFEGSDTKLEIMTRPEIKENPEIMTKPENIAKSEIQANSCSNICLGYIHFAISLGTKAKVDELTAKIKNDGYTVLSGPRITGDGYYESCILDPENNQIEITE